MIVLKEANKIPVLDPANYSDKAILPDNPVYAELYHTISISHPIDWNKITFTMTPKGNLAVYEDIGREWPSQLLIVRRPPSNVLMQLIQDRKLSMFK